MNYRLALSLFLIANICVAAPAKVDERKKTEVLRPAQREQANEGGLIDTLVGVLYPDTIVRRFNDLVTFWGWARELNRAQYPEVYASLAEICERLNVPVPVIYVINNSGVNAKLLAGKINATVNGWSPRYAAITITQDTLDLLNQDELDAYLTQAVARIKHRSFRLTAVLNGLLQCNPINAAIAMGPQTAFVPGPNGQLIVQQLPGRSPVMAAVLSLVGQRWLRSKIDECDRTTAFHLKNPAAFASAIAKENEHAGMPYKIGSNPILRLFNDWPTAEERLETVEKVRKQVAN